MLIFSRIIEYGFSEQNFISRLFGADKNIVKNTRKTPWHTIHINCNRHTVVVAQRTISVSDVLRILLYRQITRRKVKIFAVFVFKLNSALLTMRDDEHLSSLCKINVTTLHMYIVIHKAQCLKTQDTR